MRILNAVYGFCAAAKPQTVKLIKYMNNHFIYQKHLYYFRSHIENNTRKLRLKKICMLEKLQTYFIGNINNLDTA